MRTKLNKLLKRAFSSSSELIISHGQFQQVNLETFPNAQQLLANYKKNEQLIKVFKPEEVNEVEDYKNIGKRLQEYWEKITRILGKDQLETAKINHLWKRSLVRKKILRKQ